MKSVPRIQFYTEMLEKGGISRAEWRCLEQLAYWPKPTMLPKYGDPWPFYPDCKLVDIRARPVWRWYKPWTWFCREWEVIHIWGLSK